MKVNARAWALGAAMIAATSIGGCATTDYVKRMVGVEDSKVSADQSRLDQHDSQLANLDKASREALERARAAGKLAEGKFVYSVILSDDSVKFASHSAQLSPEAQTRLMDFVQKLKSENKNVYVEIQGHIDPTEKRDMKLGEARAEAVRRFMNQQGVPLNRMSTISYGDGTPAAPNDTREGRAQNRRVVLQVLG